jgi:ATP-dependent Clp protease ATP-binding subunit ClpC
MVDSTELAQVLAEAEDIAKAVGQPITSAHLLLAVFTVENRAQVVLHERGVDEDRLLEAMTAAPREDEGLLRELCARTREIAASCGSAEADCLHLLIAATRVRCLAQELLTKTGLDLTALRNNALSYFLSGRMPRKLQPGRLGGQPPRPAVRPVGSPPSPLPAATAVLSVPEPATRPLTARDLVDSDEEEAPAAEATPEEAPGPRRTARTAAAPAGVSLDPKRFPMLSSLGRNLTQCAYEGRLDPVIGRAREVDEVIDVLGKRRTNNPCLVGEPGVGKTAVVEGVAQKLLGLRGALAQKVVVEIDMGTLVAGTQLRGSFSEKLNALKDEVRRAEGRVIVFIDELHTLVGAGSTGEGPQDAANELKSAMARGEFPCIGATTHDEFRKYISADAALERRFTPVVVTEPSIPETMAILAGIISRYEDHHGLQYAPQSLEAAASLAAKYVTDRFLPDKAIAIVDLAGSRCRREGKERVEPADVAQVVAKLAGIPEERLLMNDSARLLRLEEDLGKRVVGHQEALSRIARVVRRNYAGFSSRRPMGTFLFMGPTGVGKTELARALADVLFGNRDALIRIDMSELSEAHGVSRLIGAPPGYVGYGDAGQLTEPVRRRPSSVVILDEIEKAHREIQLLLLQVLEEGRLTDGKGRHIDFSNAVVVMTTNLGSEAFSRKGRAVGFGAMDASSASATQAAESAVRGALPPELWNRIDERLVFAPLSESNVARIAELLLAESSRRLAAEKGIEYVAGSEVVTHLLRSGGFDPSLGARPMRQTLQRLVEGPLAERILLGDFTTGDRVRVELRGGELIFRKDRLAATSAAPLADRLLSATGAT